MPCSLRWECCRYVCIQPDRHEPDPRELVGAEHTARTHAGLHKGSISVGAGGGGPRQIRRAVAMSALLVRRRAVAAVQSEQYSPFPRLTLKSRALLAGDDDLRRSSVVGGLAEKGVAGSRHYTASVVSQRAGSAPGDLISVYTGAIARFLVGNSPSTCRYVI
jgi:hypothetical protein